jgi:hypothetical protein
MHPIGSGLQSTVPKKTQLARGQFLVHKIFHRMDGGLVGATLVHCNLPRSRYIRMALPTQRSAAACGASLLDWGDNCSDFMISR